LNNLLLLSSLSTLSYIESRGEPRWINMNIGYLLLLSIVIVTL